MPNPAAAAAPAAVLTDKPAKAAALIKAGGVVICPTEGVYGFSCLYDNEAAVERILSIKGRSAAKGLITICADVQQALALVKTADLPDRTLQLLRSLWPGPHTFVMPCRDEIAGLLTGFRPTIALRVPSFTLLSEFIELCGRPLVSTSVNLSGRAPLKDLDEVTAQFGSAVDGILTLPCQGLSGPSSIHDGLTGTLIRQGGQ